MIWQTGEDESGAFRVNDLAWAKSQGTYEDLEKLYNFILNRKNIKENDNIGNQTTDDNQDTYVNPYDEMIDVLNISSYGDNICSDSLWAVGEGASASSCYNPYIGTSVLTIDEQAPTSQEELNNSLLKMDDCASCASRYIYDDNSNMYTFYCDIQNHKMTNCKFDGYVSADKSINVNSYNKETGEFYGGIKLSDIIGN